MIKERVDAMRPVAMAMHSAEEAFNVLLESLGTAFASIAHARMQPGTHAPLEVGMSASEEIAAAALNAAQGYKNLVLGHRQLAKDRDDLIPGTVRLDGDIFYTPPQAEAQSVAQPARHLRAA